MNPINRTARPRIWIWTLAAALLLGGCGFHPRGQIKLPENLQAIAVQSADPLNPLKQVLQRQLQASGLYNEAATSSIEIVSDQMLRETLSVNDRARVSEFVLRYSVSFRINQKTGDQVTAGDPQTLEVRREYSFDETQALGAAQEESIISEELRREMAELILLRLQRLQR